MNVLHLDELDQVPIGDTLWKPIRSTLGVRAFGINAYVARNAGDTLFEEHDETEAGAGRQRHEELYLVLEGKATFTVDGGEVDAPAGTLLFVEDPAARRKAVAQEPKTEVLALGGPVGEGYEVAPWEYWFRALGARARGDEEQVRAIAEEGLAQHPGDTRLETLLGGAR